ncbi:unnamed protein product [Ectocarpus fasciculatus]
MKAAAMMITSLILMLLGKPSLITATAAKGETTLTNSGPMRGYSADPAAFWARSLQEDGNCTEDTVFVDSLITDLGYPIGGCYDMATTLLRGFPFYALGGGAAAGDAWIYVSTTGSWEIGIVDEVDESTGDVSSLSPVCTSEGEGLLAADLPEGDNGPTSSELDGTWECTFFQDGVTNYLSGDFTGVECGCDGRTTVVDVDTESSSGGGVGSTTIAIAVLAVLAVLAVVVCGCFIRVRRGKAVRKDVDDAVPKEVDEDVTAAAASS